MDMDKPLCVAFDCDGVLADSISSWKTIHDHYGTDSGELLSQFMAGELSDSEFMAADIALWKEKSPKIHRDDIFRAYSGCKLMEGAKELVAELKENGVYVAIVSAGVDLYVQSINSLWLRLMIGLLMAFNLMKMAGYRTKELLECHLWQRMFQ